MAAEPILAATLNDLPTRYNATVDLLEGNLSAGRGGKTAYIDRQGSWTYAQLSERVDRVGGLLADLGVQREQRVLVCLHDEIDFPAVFLGAWEFRVFRRAAP